MTDTPVLYFLLFISKVNGKNLFYYEVNHALERLGNARSAKIYTLTETKFGKKAFLSKGSL